MAGGTADEGTHASQLGIATNELMQNAALARPGNAAAMVSILSNADRLEMRLADERVRGARRGITITPEGGLPVVLTAKRSRTWAAKAA